MEGTQAKQGNFEGWCVVEIYGHTKEAGFGVIEFLGSACLLRIDTPEFPARQETLERPEWNGSRSLPIGTVIEREAIEGRTRYLGIGSIFSLNPCTEQVARAAVLAMRQRQIKVLSFPQQQLPLPGEPTDEELANSSTAPIVCEPCGNGDHANCTMADSCTCKDPRDGEHEGEDDHEEF